MSDLVKTSGSALASQAKGIVQIQSFSELMQFSDMLAKSDLAPADYKGKPANCMIAIQMGSEVGLAPMQAIQNIAVINGRPSMWGDAALAICLPHIESHEEDLDDEELIATCTIVRPGKKPVTRSFSQDDAKKAGLWNKTGPWTNYPKRMLQMRARGFALRDSCPDILKGLNIREETEDYEPINVTPSTVSDLPKEEVFQTIFDHDGYAELAALIDSQRLQDNVKKATLHLSNGNIEDFKLLPISDFPKIEGLVLKRINEKKKGEV